MRPYGAAKQLEARRHKAIELCKAGVKISLVARRVNTSNISVYRWWCAYQKGGLENLKPKPTPGRTPKLTRAQREELITLLLEGPIAAGYKTNLWTLKRIAMLIKKHFGIRYHPSHLWKLLQSFDWSCQKPENRAIQRDDEAIAKWKRYNWSWIKKKCKS